MDPMQDPFTDLEINSRHQLSILEACRRHNPEIKLVFASTRQVCGRPTYLPVDEKHPIRPVDVNGMNKMAGEFYHLLYNNVYHLKSCVLRLTNTYGPGMRMKDARQTFLGIWIKLLVEGKPFEEWDADQLRDFTFVDDAVTALLLATLHDHSNVCVFNLGGDVTVTLRQLSELIVEIDGHGEYVMRPYTEDRKPTDIGSYYSDYSLIRNKLGWEPRMSLKDGLSRTIEFYRVNHSQYQ